MKNAHTGHCVGTIYRLFHKCGIINLFFYNEALMENNIFDFATYNPFKIDFELYKTLIKEDLKSYSVTTESSRAIVSIINAKDETFECIYKILTYPEIVEIFENDEKTDLIGCYFNNFTIKLFQKYNLINFNACYSFWDGGADFAFSAFSGESIQFCASIFVNGDIEFHGSKLLKTTLDFCYSNFMNCSFKLDYINFLDSDFTVGASNFQNSALHISNCNWDNGELEFTFANFNDTTLELNYSIFNNSSIESIGTYFTNCLIKFFDLEFQNGKVLFEDIYSTNTDWLYKFCNFSSKYFYILFSSFCDCNIIFVKTEFYCQEIVFESVDVKNLIFFNNTIGGHTNIQLNTVNQLFFQNCIFEKILKVTGTPSSLSFYESTNLGTIQIDWFKSKLMKAISKGKKIDIDRESTITYNEFNNYDIKNQFRILKENYHNLGEYNSEDKAYRQYMKYHTNKWYRTPYKLFKWIGGYGTQPLPIFIAMLLVIISFAIIYVCSLNSSFSVYGTSQTISFLDALYYSGITFLTIGYGDISPIITGTALRFTSIVEGFFGLFLMSYFTVSFVRKILR